MTITIPRHYKPELCVSTDATREVLMHPYLKWAGDVASIVSTNGRFLVSLPVEVSQSGTHGLKLEPEKQENGYLSKDAVILARKHRIDRNGPAVIDMDEEYLTLPNGWKLPRPDKELNFPNTDQVIPKGPWKNRLSFNAKFLWQISQGIGSEQVVLEFNGPMEAFMVRSVHDKAFGVLMPCRYTEPDQQRR